MNDTDTPAWPSRPRLTGRFEFALASFLSIICIGFIVLGTILAVSTNQATVAEEYEPAGTETPYGTLYLGSSITGSDLLGDIVSAAWLTTWFGGLTAGIALLIAFPIARSLSSDHPIAHSFGKLFLRISASLGVWPLIGVLVFTEYVLEVFSTYAPLPFALFVLPTAIGCLTRLILNARPDQFRFIASITIWLRLWATIMMMLALLSFFYSPAVGGMTLTTLVRDNATLITFGITIPLIPAFLMIFLAITLRFWASIIEDRLGLTVDPYADSWIFLPTILENELDERRVRKEYDGL